MNTLLIATNNTGKTEEMLALLAGVVVRERKKGQVQFVRSTLRAGTGRRLVAAAGDPVRCAGRR